MTNNPFATVEAIPRKVMTLIYLVDTSGSMSGSKIAALNTAVQETLPVIEDISRTNADAVIKVAVLEFSSDVRWMYPEPVDVADFRWSDLTAGGLTALGGAYEELNNKLSYSHGFMREPAGSYAPVILLMSDGAPTDDTAHGLAKLRANNWYKSATKIAIAIGNDCYKKELELFTGTDEAVLTVHNIDELKKIITLVSVTASRVNSQTTSVGADAPDKQTETIDRVKEGIESDPTLAGTEVGRDTGSTSEDYWGDTWG